MDPEEQIHIPPRVDPSENMSCFRTSTSLKSASAIAINLVTFRRLHLRKLLLVLPFSTVFAFESLPSLGTALLWLP